MFRPLGLLGHVSCPAHAQGVCETQRTECPFDHSLVAVLQKTTAPASSSAAQEKVRPTVKKNSDSPKPSSSSLTAGAQRPQEAVALATNALKRPRSKQASPPISSSAEPHPSVSKPDREKQRPESHTKAPSLGKTKEEEEPGWTTVSHRKRPANDQPDPTEPTPTRKSANVPSRDGDSSSGNTSTSSDYRRPPNLTLAAHPRTSRIPFSSRSTSLKTLWSIFTTAYSPLIEAENPQVQQVGRRLAHEDARQQELEVFAKATKASYRPSIVTAAVGIKKRDQATLRRAAEEAEESFASPSSADVSQAVAQLRSTCSEIGTTSVVQAKRDAEEKRAKTRLTVTGLLEGHMVCPVDQLAKYGYDVPPSDGRTLDEFFGVAGGSEPTATGDKKDCIRCQKQFIVGPEQEPRACHYHSGKKFFERDPSSGERGRVQKWSCCGRSIDTGAGTGISLSAIASYGGGPTTSVEGDMTCGVGPHVFKEETTADLHKREAFTTFQTLHSDKSKVAGSMPLDIVALDCELGFTTAGLSLTRVTLLDESGSVVLDELCKPHADVVDANVQFSGVSAEQLLQPGVKSFEEVQSAVAHFIGPDTILLGHGLENDLRALRVLHTRIVDTAMLFPHARGLPFRQKLKTLAYNHLGRTIQSGSVTEGHSSAEDAKASLDLVKWKVSTEPRTPFTPQHDQASVLRRVSTSGQPAAAAASQSPTSTSTPSASAGAGATRVLSQGRTISAGPRLLPRAGAISARPPAPPVRTIATGNSAATRRPSESATTAAPTPSLFIPRRK